MYLFLKNKNKSLNHQKMTHKFESFFSPYRNNKIHKAVNQCSLGIYSNLSTDTAVILV